MKKKSKKPSLKLRNLKRLWFKLNKSGNLRFKAWKLKSRSKKRPLRRRKFKPLRWKPLSNPSRWNSKSHLPKSLSP
jgi:hypothetical protein